MLLKVLFVLFFVVVCPAAGFFATALCVGMRQRSKAERKAILDAQRIEFHKNCERIRRQREGDIYQTFLDR
jgi:hypothetical protein